MHCFREASCLATNCRGPDGQRRGEGTFLEFTQGGLQAAGFDGFVSFGALDTHYDELSSPGVYAVLRPEASELMLTETNTGFWYQARNPAYRLSKLQKRWDLPTPVLYIGKAGDIEGGGTTLWQRLQLFRRYGAGENVAHRGGRAIWQVQGAASQLRVCWMTTPGLDPECVEDQLLELFKKEFRALPLANQKSGKKCKHKPVCRLGGAAV